MSTRSKRTSGDPRKRAGQASARRRYWHGGIPGLSTGTELLTRRRAERELDTTQQYDAQAGYDLGVTNPDRVYFTSDLEVARAFASLHAVRDDRTGVIVERGAVYEVAPSGPITEDEDFTGTGLSWCSPGARVLRTVEPAVHLDRYEGVARIGRTLTWDDNSPMYGPDGAFLPSRAMRARGYTEKSMASRYRPWTPFEYVEADLNGGRTGDRSIPAEHVDVLAAASEPAATWQCHVMRTSELQAEGIVCRGAELSDLPAVDALIAGTPAPLTRGAAEDRGIVVVEHPADGIIATAVIEAAEFSGQPMYWISAVSVVPAWRRRGIATVLLNSAQLLLPNPPVFAAGRCIPELAPLVAKAGFTVLKPGAALPLALSDRVNLLEGSSDRCWFYRDGPI